MERGAEKGEEDFFFISFNCSVHYPMQIKIIRRLKDVFIFHSSIYISLFLSLLPLFVPPCPPPLPPSLFFPLSLISTLPLDAYHVRFLSLCFSFLLFHSFHPFCSLHLRGFCILFFGGAYSTTILILCSPGFFSSYARPTTRCRRAFYAFLPDAPSIHHRFYRRVSVSSVCNLEATVPR